MTRRASTQARPATLLNAGLIGSLALLLAGAPSAEAAEFTVSPTRVDLDAGRPTQTLVFGNQSESTLSFEVSVRSWRQDGTGQWVLEDSDELVVHPRMLHIEPGQRGNLRVGFLDEMPEHERAYRIEVNQLPHASVPRAGAVQMLTRVSLPVFTQYTPGHPGLRLVQARWQQGRLWLQARNEGSRHVSPMPGTLRVFDAQHQEIARTDMTLGYVLAGASIELERPGLGHACRTGTRIEFTAEGLSEPLLADVDTLARTCAD